LRKGGLLKPAPDVQRRNLFGEQRRDVDPDFVRVHFRSAEDRARFLKLIGKHPLTRGSVWFSKPPEEREEDAP